MNNKKIIILVAFCLTLILASALYSLRALGDMDKSGDIPDVDGIYNMPGRKNLKVRVFVHQIAEKKQPPAEPTLYCPPDDESSSVVGSTGWKLPANWHYSLNVESVPLRIKPDIEEIATDCFDSWVNPLGGKLFVSRDSFDSTATRKKLDGINTIAWGPTPGNALGITYVWYDNTGLAVETDTIMNNKLTWYWSNSNTCSYTDVYDAQNTLTHEVGHWFGLDDHKTIEYKDNTMYGYGAVGESKKNTPTVGDTDGLQKIYQ